jgi:hypothetical protein
MIFFSKLLLAQVGMKAQLLPQTPAAIYANSAKYPYHSISYFPSPRLHFLITNVNISLILLEVSDYP